MIGTYLAVLAVCAASLVLGQAAVTLCGGRRWSWLSPALGLALLCALCWGTVRLPGEGTSSAILILVLVLAALFLVIGRTEGSGEAVRKGLPVGIAALIAASLPFAVEGHFGILGTSLNPDMSQHLLAAARLAEGGSSQLLRQGYPLGPHAVVVTLNKGLGIGLVQGFSGLTVAVAVLAPLTALSALTEKPPLRRSGGALIIGLPYLVASYFAQGAFKEVIESLLVLAFALALRESARSEWARVPLRFVPAAILAVGSVYVYSFPGLIWPAGTVAIWAFTQWAWGRYASAAGPAPGSGPATLRDSSLALIVFAVGVLPELGRMIDFHNFETFNPNGPGLGNLFGQISPFTALGIWPSGDFRVAPGGGAAPAAAFYLGGAFASALLLNGLLRCCRRREAAILAGFLAGAAVYVGARAGGTAYTAAKALEVVAPLATAVIVVSLSAGEAGRPAAGLSGRGARVSRLALTAAVIYALAAAGCSLLAFANAPVGPTDYSPGLAELRPLVRSASTLVLAPSGLLDEQHGRPFLAWELRGGRVCIRSESEAGAQPPAGVRFLITSEGAGAPPYRGFHLRRVAAPYALWERRHPPPGKSACPLVEVRQARQGAHP